MKLIIILFLALPHLSVYGQLIANRKQEVEKLMENVYSVKEFQQIASSLRLSVSELSDYPVIFPVKKPLRITSGFGIRRHPISKKLKRHKGIDIAKVKGTPVHASGNGIVTRTGNDTGYGIFIEIKHSGNFRSFYAHLSKTIVNVGDTVSATQPIAYVGSTGRTTGCHLHYEVRKNKQFLNPTDWCYCLVGILENKL